MAAPVNTIRTASLVGIREDLEDTIYNLSPDETPLFSALSKSKVKNQYHEWQTDTLRASADNAHIEGDDSTAEARTATSRVGNRCQIFKNTVQTSGSEAAADKAGRETEMAYQIVKVGKEQKLDIERALFLNRAQSAGSSVAPAYMAGLGAWIATNDTQVGGGSPASPTGNGTDTRTDGTTTAFTQTRFDATAQQVWDTCGGKATSVFLSSTQMNVALGFVGSNNQRSNVDGDGKVIKDIVLYRTPWGTFDFTLSRQCRSRDVWLLNPDMLGIGQYRPMKTEELAKTGDSTKRHIVTELTLIVKTEAAHGLVPDNS